MVGVRVGVGVGVCVGVAVFVGVGVDVAVKVAVGVGVSVARAIRSNGELPASSWHADRPIRLSKMTNGMMCRCIAEYYATRKLRSK